MSPANKEEERMKKIISVFFNCYSIKQVLCRYYIMSFFFLVSILFNGLGVDVISNKEFIS